MNATINGLEKVCPFCAETIKAAAVVCRFCNRELPSSILSTGDAPAAPYGPCRRCGGTTRSEFMERTGGWCRACAVIEGRLADGERVVDDTYIYGTQRGAGLEIVAAPKQGQTAKQNAEKGTAIGACVFGGVVLLCAGMCSGVFSSASSTSDSHGTSVAPSYDPPDDELMNRPSLRGFSDAEKRTIIDAAKDFDRKVRDLERRRGY
jgi:hypothetical protein